MTVSATSPSISIEPVGALGARVVGLPVGPLTPEATERLRLAMAEHGVLIFEDSTAGDGAFADFMASFGPAVFTTGETPVEGHPSLNVVSNVGRTTPPRSVFHIDTSYVSRPPAYSALRAVTVPEAGGETVFTDQFAAFDTLERSIRTRLRDAIVTHDAGAIQTAPGEERSARHPLFLRHPAVDRTSLYLSTPARCVAISGLQDAEAADTIAALYDHSTQPPFALRHRWRPGDVVVWDNRRTLHRAEHEGALGDRVLHRGMSIDAADAAGTSARSNP